MDNGIRRKHNVWQVSFESRADVMEEGRPAFASLPEVKEVEVEKGLASAPAKIASSSLQIHNANLLCETIDLSAVCLCSR
jgi:hypothetical protein